MGTPLFSAVLEHDVQHGRNINMALAPRGSCNGFAVTGGAKVHIRPIRKRTHELILAAAKTGVAPSVVAWLQSIREEASNAFTAPA